MKMWLAAAAIAACAVLVGCRAPTNPSFSPDGSTLAYEKGKSLYLRRSGEDRRIDTDVSDDVEWSPDGKKLAFNGQNGATILDLATGRKASAQRVSSPFFWREGQLLGMGQRSGDTVEMVALNPETAAIETRFDLPVVPSMLAPVGGGEAVVWSERSKAHVFDGLSLTRRSDLDDLVPLRPSDPNGTVYAARIYARPHTHIMLAQLVRIGPGLKVVPGDTIDVAARYASDTTFPFLVGASVAPNGSSVAVVVHVAQLRAQDGRRLNGIFDRYDLWNHLRDEHQPQMTREDDEFMQHVFDRGRGYDVCLARVGKQWREYRSSITQRAAIGKQEVDNWMRVGLNRDGSKLAISTDEGTVVRSLR